MPVPAGHSRWHQRVRLRSEDVKQEQLANRLCSLFLFCVSKCSAHIVKNPLEPEMLSHALQSPSAAD